MVKQISAAFPNRQQPVETVLDEHKSAMGSENIVGNVGVHKIASEAEK